MRRLTIAISLFTLGIGLLAGSHLRPAPTVADEAATPPSDIVFRFESVGLADLPISPERPDAGGTSIELRRSDGSSSPAWVSLTRYTYQPGGYINLPYSYPGPVAYYIESGTMTLAAIGPNVTIVEVERTGTPGTWQGMTALGPGMRDSGGRYEVEAGDYVYAMDGNLGPTRNDGDTPLIVLAIFLQAMDGFESDYEEFPPPATPSS